MSCVFCQIIEGQGTPLCLETPDFVAFPDTRPIRPGHLQLIPRICVDCFEDLPGPLAGAWMQLGQRIARVLKSVYHAPRVGFVVSGHEVAHVHAHLIPLHAPDDITSARYAKIPNRVDPEVVALEGERLRQALDGVS